uniref:DNA circularization N-terminal domain-containing protein n=1 Tax=Vibrio cholerae TaxID=666 RepID=UPI003F58FABD
MSASQDAWWVMIMFSSFRITEALNQVGPGELIHPWFGVRKVQVGAALTVWLIALMGWNRKL